MIWSKNKTFCIPNGSGIFLAIFYKKAPLILSDTCLYRDGKITFMEVDKAAGLVIVLLLVI